MQAILPDQSMCVAILKIVNSAFFGSPRQISSIEEAVIVLGFLEIRNIVLTQAVFSSFQKFRHISKPRIDTLWQHSLTCGLAAKMIADRTAGYSPSHLFIAGLIHDIGKLTLLMAYPNYSPASEVSGHLALTSTAEEKAQFGISHDQVGMRLLNRWLFPEQLCAATGSHHHPASAPDNAAFPLLIQMADILSHAIHSEEMTKGRDVLDLIDNLTPDSTPLWSRYNLHWQEEDIEQWLTDLREALQDGTLLEMFNA
jgi:HD-like signal output (HDOD) protein